MLAVLTLDAADLDWANAHYAAADFQPSSVRDLLVAATTADGERVGVGRLVPLDAASAELGGIYVLPAHRGRQVARALVSGLLERSRHAALYCLPFAHLADFYCRFGFVPATDGLEVPRAVRDKLAWCASRYVEPVSLLVRTAR